MKKIGVGDFRIGPEERAEINEVLDSNWVSEGPKVNLFQSEWAKFIGTKHSVVLNSGTSAIMAGLTSLSLHSKVKKGRKVITSALTYIATANAVSLSHHEPVFADIGKSGLLIDPEKVAEILENDKNGDYSVLMPVHIMGYPCDMDKLNAIAKKHGLVTFEDSAQAHGTFYKGKRTGSLSMLSDFSFYVAHNIAAGEMGTINTNDDELLELITKIKSSSKSGGRRMVADKTAYALEDEFKPFFHDTISYNFKATEFQAALARTQIRHADEIIKARQENVKYLNEGLSKFDKFIELPAHSKDVSYLSYPIIIKDIKKFQRLKVREALAKKGIESRALFGSIPLHQPAYHHLKKQYAGKLPNSERVGLAGFYIGCHQLLSKEDLDVIIKSFSEIFH